jgi:nucleotide-binding universal stress UspA family protein
MLLGSVSEGVVHHARCPVLVVRGGEEAWPPRRVIAGDDGSHDAGKAAGMATGIGKLFRADVALVRAHSNPPEPIGGWSAEDRRRLDEARLREGEALEKRAKGLQEALGGPLETRVVDGDAALALLVVAEEGNEEKTLLAVGSRGLDTLRRMRLGSVSTNVLRVARGPVLICPRAGEVAALPGAEEAATVRPSG